MSALSDLNVSNVFLYIGDAIRWDALPKSVAKRGLTIKTVAASIHTPTSFASIVTGLHPPQHGVNQFGDKLHPDVPSLFSLEGVHSAFANTINEHFNENPESKSLLGETLNMIESPPDSISDIDPPFVFVERGPGGHAPYGNYSGNGWEYYRDRKAAPESKYREEYRESVNLDRQYFESQLTKLEKRCLLDDTLIIYTSDHGELLGEGGCLGHNAPIHPKLAYVPSVLIHPSLNDLKVADGLLRHVDLFPTIATILDKGISGPTGRDLTNKSLSELGVCSYRKTLVPKAPIISGELSYESVWDVNGGYVCSQTGKLNSSFILIGKLLKSAKREYMRHHLQQVIPFYLRKYHRYGLPGFTMNQGKKLLNSVNNLSELRTSESIIDEAAEERLRELGYMK